KIRVPKSENGMRPARVERATSGSGGQRSIQLSYGRRKQARNLAGDQRISREETIEREKPVFRFSFCNLTSKEGKCRPASGRAHLRQDYGAAGKGSFMNQIIDAIEKEQQKGNARQFSVGDSVRVHTRVVEGDKERIHVFAGIVIGRKGRGLNETFTVRRISYGEGVERVFPLHSPRIAKVEVEQQGRVRRARLNYLRGRKGKEATAVRE